jgi:hypothetical protein
LDNYYAAKANPGRRRGGPDALKGQGESGWFSKLFKSSSSNIKTIEDDQNNLDALATEQRER